MHKGGLPQEVTNTKSFGFVHVRDHRHWFIRLKTINFKSDNVDELFHKCNLQAQTNKKLQKWRMILRSHSISKVMNLTMNKIKFLRRDLL